MTTAQACPGISGETCGRFSGAAVQIGVDFGGTKIEAAALAADGAFLARRRVPNPGDYAAALRVVRELVDAVEHEVGCRGTIGVGTPGSISPRTGIMRNSNSVYLNGRDFNRDLSAALGREIRMANDANCLALSEVVDGAARGSRVTFAVIVGTGCGGGVVVNGQLIEGANGIGGEWGHIPLPWATPEELAVPLCWCGQRGCLETWVSGTGLQHDYTRATGESLPSAAIIAAARAGDTAAAATFERYVDRLGGGLAMICNLLDPDTIVLGGGLSNVTELYDLLPFTIRRHVFSDAWDARIVPAQWGDSSGVRGAARLWHAE